jgi:hypothetical protein
MTPDWTQVALEHVHQAYELYDSGASLPKRAAKSTFLLINGKTYPAKFIRGLAYRLATGVDLDPSRDYSGGLETIRFFESLGLSTRHNSTSEPETSTAVPVPPAPVGEPPTAPKEHREPQKRALAKLLRQRFGSVETEAEFPWLTVPAPDEMDDAISGIFNTLKAMRGFTEFITPGKPLRCDFFVPGERLIVEYDERQHFTEQRAKALEQFPPGLQLAFSREEWIAACLTIKATDPTPPHRDEQRAFYDSLRDILASRNGVRLIRIRFGTDDWTGSDVAGRLDAVLGAASSSTTPSPTPTVQVSPKRSGENISKDTGCWVATLLLEHEEQHEEQDYNSESLRILAQTVEQTLDRMSGAGVILFPAGWFWTGMAEAVTLYDWAAKETSRCLSGRASRSVVCVGIDGNCDDSDRPARDQTALAISSRGILAAARKFCPTGDEEGYIIHAAGPLQGEQGWERMFSISGRKMYLCVCNDVYGIKNGGQENPGVDVVLNLAHQFNPHGEGASGVSYFARLGFAGAARKWNCLVVGSVVFVRRPVLENWPSGVLWNQGDLLLKKWTYEMNPVRPCEILHFSTSRGPATIRVYKLAE